ncbi:4'-phosphopantetheinyl transferase superfamily protein [Oceanimonas sp. AH20CE76]|uniref:4'-phosphopantetheinyl transferase family protein n=1 Tax=Oceanimonas sp. AH20CE76 TaxID=2977120 RepID=UPI0031FF29E9
MLFRPGLANVCFIGGRFDRNQLAKADTGRLGLNKASAKRRAEFMAGRRCAAEALYRLAGVHHMPAMGPKRAPVWPAGFTGSISHSDTHAAAVVARTRDYCALGVDIEPCLANNRATALLPALLTADEQTRLTEACLGEQVTLAFSLKESLYKALYPLTQTQFYFQDAEVLASANGRARLRLVTGLNAHWPAGTEVAAKYCRHGDHLITLVAIAAEKSGA